MKWHAERALAMILPAMVLAGCGVANDGGAAGARAAEPVATLKPSRVVSDHKVKIGEPYQAHGAQYAPADIPGYDELGYASWYGDELRGNPTANGERFDPDGISAAHRTLPMPSYVEITALDTGRTILARINDRGPFAEDRLIDLSHGAARQLGISGHGHAPVRVRRVAPGEADKTLLRAGVRAAERERTPRDVIATLRRRLAGLTRKAIAANEARLPPATPGSASAPPQTASVMVPDTPPPGTAWYVQLATFSGHERARGMAARTGARVAPAGSLYRVRYGPFANGMQANEALRSANAKGYPDARVLADFVP